MWDKRFCFLKKILTINAYSVDDDDDGEALRGTSGVNDCGVFFISQPPLSLPL